MKTVAIITAAGYGKRMGQPKQFLELGGKPVLEQTISVFDRTKVIDEIVLVVNPEDVERAKKFKYAKLKKVVGGGKERQDSVYNGLKALPEDVEIVAIHDGARPFVTSEIIEKAIEETKRSGAVVVGVPVKDTIKSVAGDKLQVTDTLNRNELWAAQTPQVFKKDIILKAFHDAQGKHEVTDDAMLVEKLGIPVKMVMGLYQNIKITTPDDLIIAEGIIKEYQEK
ncbi:MAG: 2-C-methyl-D-erythritol 4-phosphate cytidylyltransferase [Candidatus Margulisiibacteriota bacterium]